jgi:hypothetical protein
LQQAGFAFFVLEQLKPQLPQLFGSVFRLVQPLPQQVCPEETAQQVPLQLIVPPVQVQIPLIQVPLPLQHVPLLPHGAPAFAQLLEPAASASPPNANRDPATPARTAVSAARRDNGCASRFVISSKRRSSMSLSIAAKKKTRSRTDWVYRWLIVVHVAMR